MTREVDIPLTDEVLKIINEHQVRYDKKLNGFYMLGIVIFIAYSFIVQWQIQKDLQDLRSEIKSVMQVAGARK